MRPEPARLADQRMLAERVEAAPGTAAPSPRLLDDAVALVDLDRLQRDGGRDRMARHR